MAEPEALEVVNHLKLVALSYAEPEGRADLKHFVIREKFACRCLRARPIQPTLLDLTPSLLTKWDVMATRRPETI